MVSENVKVSNHSRVPNKLNYRLERNLASYAAAAAGLALSAGTMSAQTSAAAKIIYTAANINVVSGTTLDLNADGIPDFSFGFDFGDHESALAMHALVAGNAILCSPATNGCFGVAVGKYGRPVGPKKQFVSNTISPYSFSGGGVFMAVGGVYLMTYFDGPWAYAKNRYVGVKFLISGKVHYGWIRMSVGNWLKGQPIHISGYAYEAEANTRILDGHETASATVESDSSDSASLFLRDPATLGALANGAAGLTLWRRH